MVEDHYKILEVSSDASQEEIKKSYRKLALKWHPDRHQSRSSGPEAEKSKKIAEEKFKKISDSYQILSDPSQKRQYDMLRSGNTAAAAGMSGAGGFSAGGFDASSFSFQDPMSVFEQFFNNHNNNHNNNNNNNGQGGFRTNIRTGRSGGAFHFSTNISTNSFVNMSSTQTTTQVINGRTVKKEVIINNGQKKETTWVDGVKLEEGQNIQTYLQ